MDSRARNVQPRPESRCVRYGHAGHTSAAPACRCDTHQRAPRMRYCRLSFTLNSMALPASHPVHTDELWTSHDVCSVVE